MKNPFPGMNPYLEEHWRDVHSRLTIYICDQLQEKLPADLMARAEEQVAIDEDGEQSIFRPDVQVAEHKNDWDSVEPTSLQPADGGGVVAKPLVVMVEPETQRWVEIVEAGGRVITVIKVLSPANKSEEGQKACGRKQRPYISGGVNLVEIDLLRGGERVVAVPWSAVADRVRTPYVVCVVRATRPEAREIYPLPLRERLPAIRIPLRPTDADVVLELQPLVDQCYERGRYWEMNFRRDPTPSLTQDDAQWLDVVLRKNGLR